MKECDQKIELDVNAGKCYSLFIENQKSGDDTYGKNYNDRT